MKHLTNFKLFENKRNTRGEEITMDQAVEMFLSECDDWSLDGEQIFRGSESYPIHFIDPSKFYRPSANTGGFYQALLPNLDSWKGKPQRHRSLIMTTDESMADSFGEVFIMIPFNDTEIGQCPSGDIWMANKVMNEMFDEKWMSWSEVDGEMIDLLKVNLNIEAKDITQDSIMRMIDEMDQIPKKDWKLKYTQRSPLGHEREFELDLIEKLNAKYPNMSLRQMLTDMFSFDKNDFEIITRQNQLKDDREVWSSGKFIGIRHDKFERFKEKVFERKKLEGF